MNWGQQTRLLFEARTASASLCPALVFNRPPITVDGTALARTVAEMADYYS